MSLSIIVVFSHIIRVLSSSSVITSTASPEGGVMIPCANLPALTSVPPQPGSVHDEIILFFSSYCLSFRVDLIRRFLLLLKKKKKSLHDFILFKCSSWGAVGYLLRVEDKMKLISQPALIPRVSISAVFVEATGVAHLHTRCPPASVHLVMALVSRTCCFDLSKSSCDDVFTRNLPQDH